MADTFKFPNGGYEVVVLRKADILKSIDDNIIDKELALAIVQQCEIDAANFISTGKWTGIPFIGNIRIPKAKQYETSDEQQALIEAAKQELDHTKYCLFRRELSAENARRAKYQRYTNYIASICINNNKALFKKYCKTKGDNWAKCYFGTIARMKPINYDELDIADYEEQPID